jgi:tetratricopeptide (TPR) repeat protein
MLRQLSVFAGPFDWPAVVAIVDGPGLEEAATKREAIDRLVDHNLVSQVSLSPDRWRLLELIGEFAGSQLEEATRQATCRRHAEHYAILMTEMLHQFSAEAYLSAADAVADNGRAAYRWAIQAGEATLAYRLGAAFEWYWEQRGLMTEGRRFLEQTLALPGEVDDSLRLDVIHGAANQAWMQHDFDAAHRHTAQGLSLAYRSEDMTKVSGFLNLQARIYLEEGRYEEADQALVEGIRIGTQMLRGMDPSFMIIQRGESALGLGRLDEAEEKLREGLDGITAKQIIPFCVGWTDIAEVALARGGRSEARHALQHVAPVAHLHSRRARVFLLAVAGYVLAGNPPSEQEALAATRLLACIIAVNERAGDPLSVMAQRFLAARMATAKERAGTKQWRMAWDEGRRWTIEESMAVGRGLLESG